MTINNKFMKLMFRNIFIVNGQSDDINNRDNDNKDDDDDADDTYDDDDSYDADGDGNSYDEGVKS